MGLRIVAPPVDGVWRVGRGNDPLAVGDAPAINLGDSRAGNRFDSYTGSYEVLYFGTTLDVCFGETLNRFRCDPRLAFIEDEWADLGFMPRGGVPADWRSRRTAIKARIGTTGRFVDVEDQETREALARQSGPALAMFDVADLDVATIRGPDRRVTRFVSEVLWRLQDQNGEPAFDGIRYLSRSSTDWECWAVFDRADILEVERHPILKSDALLNQVAALYGLTIH